MVSTAPAPTETSPGRGVQLLALLLFVAAALFWFLDVGRAEGPRETVVSRLNGCNEVLNRRGTLTLELTINEAPYALRYQVEPEHRGAVARACQARETVRLVYRLHSSLAGDIAWVDAIGYDHPEHWIASESDADARRAEHRLIGLIVILVCCLTGIALLYWGRRTRAVAQVEPG